MNYTEENPFQSNSYLSDNTSSMTSSSLIMRLSSDFTGVVRDCYGNLGWYVNGKVHREEPTKEERY